MKTQEKFPYHLTARELRLAHLRLAQVELEVAKGQVEVAAHYADTNFVNLWAAINRWRELDSYIKRLEVE